MKSPLWVFARGEAGQAVVLVAITFMAMLMAVGLATDAGQLYAARRTAQEAADAAAYAGAVVTYQRTQSGQSVDAAAATAAAIADAARNGFVDGVAGRTVTVSTPPTSGPHAGNSRYTEVVIWENVKTFLVPAQSTISEVRVRGVAGAEPLNNQYAIMALERARTDNAFVTTGQADVHLTGGGILVNSSSPTAVNTLQNSAARFTITPAPNGVDINGGYTGTWPGGFPVQTAQPQVADPFSGWPPPSTAGMTTYNAIVGTVLSPGIYTVSLDAAGGTTLYLNPGIYILKAGMNGTGNADFVSVRSTTTPSCVEPASYDCGVLIFNTHTNYPGPFRSGIDTCGDLKLSGSGSSDLKAMTHDDMLFVAGVPTQNPDAESWLNPYKNMLVYQDPLCPATTEMSVRGLGSFTGTGSVYLPNGKFTFDGNNATLTGAQLIARTVNLQDGNITIDFASSNTPQPVLPRLTE